jgi:4-hydroxy-tetrahydrodipicolinate synthase
MTAQLAGYFPIMATAYLPDGAVDLASMARLAEYLISSGAHGMSPNGGDSEAAHLTLEERMQVTETVVAASAGRRPVLVGTTAADTAESVQLCRHAQQAGADAVFTHPGWGRQGLSVDELIAYYGAICEVLEIPVMVHGTGDMDVPVVQELLDRFPQIQYIKEETTHGPKLRRYVRELAGRVTVFGPGLHYPAELAWGARGVMPSCAAPRAHSRVFDLHEAGQFEAARSEWHRMLPLVFWRWHTAAGEAGKHYLVDRGVFTTPFCRQRVSLPGQHTGEQTPFGSLRLDEVDLEEMRAILATMGEPPY